MTDTTTPPPQTIKGLYLFCFVVIIASFIKNIGLLWQSKEEAVVEDASASNCMVFCISVMDGSVSLRWKYKTSLWEMGRLSKRGINGFLVDVGCKHTFS